MSDQTFISLGPYWDVLHRHRRSFYLTIVAGASASPRSRCFDPQGIHFIRDCWKSGMPRFSPNPVGAQKANRRTTIAYLDSRLEGA